MRVMQLCAGAASGGAETAFVDLSIALHRAGIDIIPVCRPHDSLTKPLIDAGLAPVTLPFGGVFDFRTRLALRALIRERQPDVVQTWMNRAAKHAPRPSKNLPPFALVARLGGYYNLKNYRGVDHFVTNTPDIRRYLIDNGVAAERVTHINNFADLGVATPPLDRATLDTPQDAFVFLTLARLHPVKGIDAFLDALATLPPNAWGWIAGDGPEHVKLKAQAENLGLGDRVRFLGWREDRGALLASADCLVFPSRFEPFGNSFAQAWGMGCPLVTTASEGPRQYVTPNVDALMTPVDDREALADAMGRMMGDSALRNRLAAAGKARFEQEFTIDACVTAYRTLYSGLRKA